MLIVILSVIVATALAGLGVKYILEFKKSQARITWREYAIGMAISPLVAVLVSWAGWSMVKNSKVNFNEYWNGWEIASVKEYTQCTRDGSCRWEYDCDPYWVTVCHEECSGTGDDRSCHQECHQEVRYHSCPYVNREYHFYVDSTLGRYTIAANVFPDNPQANRWRAGHTIPQNVIASAGVGEPAHWIAVRERCEVNQPGPVTTRRDYVNYILASERTLMKEHSSDIEDYQKRNILPSLSRNIQGYYHADKVYFVGMKPNNYIVWQKALEYLNANIGYQMQGDLHLVVVKDDTIASNPDRYSMALKAFWQNKVLFGKDSLSKNAIVIVTGTTNEKTISWSRAFTGMPLGNEKFIVVMRDGLKGLSLNPETLLGPLFSQRNGNTVFYPPGGGQPGPIQRVIWGIDDPTTKFKRVSMAGDDNQGGFLYLKNEIQPSIGQIWAILIIAFLISCGVWVWAANHYDPSEAAYSWRRRRIDG